MKLNTKQKIVTVTHRDLGLTSSEACSFDVKIMSLQDSLEFSSQQEMAKDDVKKSSKVMKDMFVSTVTAWSGIEDGDGNDLECSAENKALVFEFDTDSAIAILDAASKKAESTKKK